MAKLQIKTPRNKEQIPVETPANAYVFVASGEGRPGMKATVTMTLTINGNAPVAGVVTSQAIVVAPPNWVLYIALASVDTTASYRLTVAQNGVTSDPCNFTFYQA